MSIDYMYHIHMSCPSFSDLSTTVCFHFQPLSAFTFPLPQFLLLPAVCVYAYNIRVYTHIQYMRSCGTKECATADSTVSAWLGLISAAQQKQKL